MRVFPFPVEGWEIARPRQIGTKEFGFLSKKLSLNGERKMTVSFAFSTLNLIFISNALV
jgi:hypothetical protein